MLAVINFTVIQQGIGKLPPITSHSGCCVMNYQ